MPALAYIPVLHEGYRRFVIQFGGDTTYLIGPQFTAQFKPIVKDIRALSASEVAQAIEHLGWANRVEVLTLELAQTLSAKGTFLAAADEDITRQVVAKHLGGCEVCWQPVFLRWDRHKTLGEEEIQPHRKVSVDRLDRELIGNALVEAGRSSDWWRHVGAVLVKDGQVILAAGNRHVPSQHMPYQDGDPRNNFSRGEYLELSTAIHAEASIIAEAAKRGIGIEGTSLYVTTFPCSPCAKLIAYSGIKACFYAAGYANLDGESILKSQGVEIVLVQMENPPPSS